MFLRRTFHECVAELRSVSLQFRAAYSNQTGQYTGDRNQVLREMSQRGIEILRVLALAIRSEQDYALVPKPTLCIGALKSNAVQDDISTINDYQPPFEALLLLPGYKKLTLREGLNKIAHFSPTPSSFYANKDSHDLILIGDRGGKPWIAILSIPAFCDVVESLPDHPLPNHLLNK